ncbi:MAG TPA: hypothetical protein VJZ00_23480 [Thermoanaerobaculia bacterium]|nr:hypothetical protein [Thermoanaerobaculia bacterium]
MKNDYPHHTYIRVRLPKFFIIYLRDVVKQGNELTPNRTSFSAMVEWWMLKMISSTDKAAIERLSKRRPEFKREAEAWMEWVAKNGEE